MDHYDLVIQLGSQVKFANGKYNLPLHTQLRTEASAIVFRTGIAPYLMITGGSNFGIRYNDQEILKPPDFTFEAFADADFLRKSEARVIKEILVNEFGVPSSRIFAESLSSTTEENAECVRIILRRHPMFTGNEKVAVMTLLYHMERALPIFQRAGLSVQPLFAENVLAESGTEQIKRVCQYYSTPKGGKQYPVDQIRQLLSEGSSLATLM